MLEALDELRGLRAAVGLDEADHDVLAARAAPVRLGQHAEGLADARRVAEEDLELAALAERAQRVDLGFASLVGHHGPACADVARTVEGQVQLAAR